jgi:hypothetical protein
MPIPFIAAAQPAIASRLAQKGLDLLSGVFRGPADQGAAEMAQAIHDKTGIDINDAAENKLGDAQWAQLKQFEFDCQSKLLTLRQQGDGDRIELERIAAADRANARQMQEAAMGNQDPWVRRFIYVYASVVTLLTFAFIFVAAFGPAYAPNDPRSRVIDTVLGFLLGVSLSAIIQYFFGSSAGSKAKDDRIGDAMRAQTQALRADQSRDRGGRP